jgi:hypothetical protein
MAMRTTLGVVIVLAVAAALWYAKTAIFLAFAGILLAIVLHGTSVATHRASPPAVARHRGGAHHRILRGRLHHRGTERGPP